MSVHTHTYTSYRIKNASGRVHGQVSRRDDGVPRQEGRRRGARERSDIHGRKATCRGQDHEAWQVSADQLRRSRS